MKSSSDQLFKCSFGGEMSWEGGHRISGLFRLVCLRGECLRELESMRTSKMKEHGEHGQAPALMRLTRGVFAVMA